MLKYILAFLATTGAVSAQGMPFAVATTQACGSPQAIFQESMDYGEQPLWGGQTLVFDSVQNPYWGTTLFTVNQDNGYWTLFTFYGENLVCITASGTGFVPSM